MQGNGSSSSDLPTSNSTLSELNSLIGAIVKCSVGGKRLERGARCACVWGFHDCDVVKVARWEGGWLLEMCSGMGFEFGWVVLLLVSGWEQEQERCRKMK